MEGVKHIYDDFWRVSSNQLVAKPAAAAPSKVFRNQVKVQKVAGIANADGGKLEMLSDGVERCLQVGQDSKKQRVCAVHENLLPPSQEKYYGTSKTR